MDNYGCIFLSDRLSTVDDVDAALSATSGDPQGNAFKYIARLDFKFFLSISLPEIQTNSNEWKDVVRRLKGTCLIVLPTLPSAYQIANNSKTLNIINISPLKLTANISGDAIWTALNIEELLELRQFDLNNIVELHKNRALLTIPSGHFELPSGAHTSHFFRVAECLSDLNTIDRIIYWIARDLSIEIDKDNLKSILLITDNPSTLILALRVAELFPNVAIQCEGLPEYPESQKAINELEEWLEDHLSEHSSMYCIISVTSTGALRNAISNAASKLEKNAAFAVVYSTNQHENNNSSYCNLVIDDYKHWSNKIECELCKDSTAESNALFQIDRSRYFLYERKIKLLALPPRYFSLQKEFLEKYGHYQNVLKAHVDDPNDENPRHHAFYIDVLSLMEIPDFQNALIDKIQKLQSIPDLILIPPHPAGVKIGAYLKHKLNLPVIYHKDLRINKFKVEDMELAHEISNCKSLLIIDDLAFTGSRMQSFNNVIRESSSIFKQPENIVFLPLVVLAEDNAVWEKTVRGLTLNHGLNHRSVEYLYKFPLPRWHKEECPWCAEYSELGRLSMFEQDDSDDQGVRLSGSNMGLRANQWLNYKEGLNIPNFGDNSPVASVGTKSIQLLFACASAIQQLRTDSNIGNQLNPNGYPFCRVLDGAVIKDFYTENLLIVSLLRSLTQYELSEEFRDHVTELIKRIIENDNSNDEWILRELLFAERRGLAQRINNNDIRLKAYSMAGQLAYLDLI